MAVAQHISPCSVSCVVERPVRTISGGVESLASSAIKQQPVLPFPKHTTRFIQPGPHAKDSALYAKQLITVAHKHTFVALMVLVRDNKIMSGDQCAVHYTTETALVFCQEVVRIKHSREKLGDIM